MTLAMCQVPDEQALEFLLAESDSSTQKKSKIFLRAIVLTHFGETFEYFNAEKLAGSFIFDSSYDELIKSMQRQKEELTAQFPNDAAKSDEEINKTIFILLMSIYAEVIYIIDYVDWWGFNKSYRTEAKILLDYFLFRDENQSIREKIIGISSLLKESSIESHQDFLLQLAHSKLEIVMDFWNNGVVRETYWRLMVNSDKRKIRQTKINDLFKKNLRALKKEAAEKKAELANIEAKRKVRFRKAKIKAKLAAKMVREAKKNAKLAANSLMAEAGAIIS